MVVFNIKVKELIKTLKDIEISGNSLVDIEIIIKNNKPKLFITPVNITQSIDKFESTAPPKLLTDIKDPDIDPNTDDIFKKFKTED